MSDFHEGTMKEPSHFSARLRFFVWLTILFVVACQSVAHANHTFKRGINLNHVMSYPLASGWPRFVSPFSMISDKELENLKTAGFDHIRLLIDPEIYLQETVAHRHALDRRLKDHIQRIHQAGLSVLAVNFTRHTARDWYPDRIFTSLSDRNYQVFSDHIAHLATMLKSYDPARVRLVLASEPQRDCFQDKDTDWTFFQRDLYEKARQAAPNLMLGVTGGCWSSIDGLAHVHMSDFDDNTFVDVHFYSPFTFTHQGATWSLPAQRYIAGLSYPSSKGTLEDVRPIIDRVYAAKPLDDATVLADAYARAQDYLTRPVGHDTLKAYFARLENWRIKQGISKERISIGEFGALRPQKASGQTSQKSRLNWIRDTRMIIEEAGFSWAMWDYFPPFSLLANPQTRTLDRPTLRALGLRAD